MWCAIRNCVRSVMSPSRAASAGGDVIVRVDALADVVQQGRQQEFLVVGPAVAGQLEHLQRMIQGVAFRDDSCGDCFTFSSGKQQQAEERIADRRRLGRLSSSPSRSRSGIFAWQELFQLARWTPARSPCR